MNDKLLQEKTDAINDCIYSYLPKADTNTELIVEACNYSVRVGGKRIRPLIMRETFALFSENGNEPPILERFMAAIEFIHTYSLIHDDLPAMDNDMYRRGQLTTHAKYGEAFGILAGDALLTFAFQTVLEGMNEISDPVQLLRASKALLVLSQKAGILGMVGGQCRDVYVEKQNISISDKKLLEYIYINKTAALLEASALIGAILAGADKEETEKIQTVMTNVGMAFQVRDDVLDVISSQEVLGKPIKSDEKNNKTTYVSLFGIEGAGKIIKEYSDEAIRILDSLEKKNNFLRELILMLVDREK